MTTRAASWADVRAITELLDAASRRWVDRPTTSAQVNDRLNTPDTDVALDTCCVLDENGVMVGFAHLWATHPDTIRCFARTRPANVGRGVGAALQTWIAERAAQLVTDPIGEPPKVLDTTTWPGDTQAEALLTSHGFTPARYYLTMVIDFAVTVPTPAPVSDGIMIRGYDPGDETALFAAYTETFTEHWGFEHPTSSEWWAERRDRETSGFDPGLWLVALDRDEIVGFSIAREQADANGVQHGYVGDVGVRPAWRGRGLAEALLTRSLSTFADRGLAYATLHVDAENLSGAVRLYTKVGMKPRPSFTIWHRPLT